MKSEIHKRSTSFYLFLHFLLNLVSVIADNEMVQADAGLLPNGDFEAGGGSPSIPRWRTNGTVEMVHAGDTQGAIILVVPHGLWAARLSRSSAISQEVTVDRSSTYSITFTAARTCAGAEKLKVSVYPTTQLIDLQTVHSVSGWDTYAFAFPTPDADTVTVMLENPGEHDDEDEDDNDDPTCGPIIDDVYIKKLFPADTSNGDFVVNGDMESGPWLSPNDSSGVLLPTNLDPAVSPLHPWIVESNRAVRLVDAEHFTVPAGRRAVELLSGKEGMISQMVKTMAGGAYQVMFSFGSSGRYCKQQLAVRAFAGDQSETFHYMPRAGQSYDMATLNFSAKDDSTRIAFASVYYNVRSDDQVSLCGPVLDDVKVIGPPPLSSSSSRRHHLLSILVLLLPLVGQSMVRL